MCRWPCFANIVQAVPCDERGRTLPPQDDATQGGFPAQPRMPPGYMARDTNAQGVRTEYTEDTTVTAEGTWCEDCVLKWSGAEITHTAEKAAEIMSQVRHSSVPSVFLTAVLWVHQQTRRKFMAASLFGLSPDAWEGALRSSGTLHHLFAG